MLFFFEDFLSTPWCCSVYHICLFHLFNFFLLLYFCLLMDTSSSFIHSLPLLLHFYPPIYCLLICYHLLSFLLACLYHPSYFRLYLPFSSHPTLLLLTFFFLPLPLVHLAFSPTPPCSPSSCPFSPPSYSLPFSTSTATLLRYYNYYYHFFIFCSSLLSI